MRILIVSSGNSGNVTPFVKQQADSLLKAGISLDHFLIKGHGALGYLRNYFLLRKKLKEGNFDIVHAHFWSSAALAVMQRKIPVVITFHGCDINKKTLRIFSKVISLFAKQRIYVNDTMKKMAEDQNGWVIPCGIDLENIKIIDKTSAKLKLGLDLNKQYILFCSSFDRIEKNYPVAKDAVQRISKANVELLELKGFSYDEVILLLNAVDLLLMTSLREGSPQIIKEAIACNCPVVSTNVGDVKFLLDGISNSFITTFDRADISTKIEDVLNNGKRSMGRQRIIDLGLENEFVSQRIIKVYKNAVGK